MPTNSKVVTTVTLSSDAPFTIDIIPREGHTPLFRIADDRYDTAWLQPLIDLLQEAQRVVAKLNPPPPRK
jgi:hypothetical protein